MDSKQSGNSIQGSVGEQPLVLAVDEDEDNILVISYLIQSLACKLITTNSGQNTLNIATKHLPDLILLEIALPDVDGFEIIEKLRQNKTTGSIPIVVVTRLSGTTEKERIINIGCNGYLCKPYLFEDLEDLIRTNLEILSEVRS